MATPARKIKIAFAPGARVLIRDEEWIVKSVKPASNQGLAVHVSGISELVRNKDAIFLTELDDIQELRPEETELVFDDSAQYRRSRLYLESLLRKTQPTDNAIYVGHRGAIRRADYQLQPAAKALGQVRPRILMADGVGLGKTIEVGVLLSELIQRGRGDRILVVALKSILAQFQEELWGRFTIPLVRLDSVGIQRVQTRIPSNMNPFYYFDRVIISIDTLKKDEKYRRYLEKCRWDAIVVDECQNVAVRTSGGSSRMAQRARLAKLLARTCDAMILTSATPHDGRSESFASLMNLLEPTAVADENNYTHDEVEDYFIRRFKKDIAWQVQESFQEREQDIQRVAASAREDAVFEYLSEIEFRTIARERNNKGVLFRTVLLKAFLSSPAACSSTIANRLKHKALQEEGDDAAAHDREVLLSLKALVDAIGPEDHRKYLALVDILKGIGLDKPNCPERIVIFSERIDTLKYLETRLKKDLGLSNKQIELFHGTLDDQDQKKLVKSFGVESSPVRILLASDVASEGINLHYQCHRMVHFDLPWSLITLEQRNGRIDRFGQKKQPEFFYLLTIPGNEELAGDLRVLDRLIEKEETATKNLGDVAWLLNLHDADREEELIAKGIEDSKAPDEILPDEPKHTDFMDILFGEHTMAEPPPEAREPIRLFQNDLEYAREGFAEIDDEDNHIEWHDHLSGFTLYGSQDLMRRFDYLPPELRTDKNVFKLTTDRQLVMDAIEEARQEEGRWPEWQLFWEQHPIAEWLNDRVLGNFRRHSAPIIQLNQGLQSDESIFLFQGVTSNHRSQPIIVDWFGVRAHAGGIEDVVPLSHLLESTSLRTVAANPGAGQDPGVIDELSALRADVVNKADSHMKSLRNERAATLSEPLREGLRKVRQWRDASIAKIDHKRQSILDSGRELRGFERRRFDDEQHEIEKRYEFRQRWISEAMRTVEIPYLRIAAVFVPKGAT